MPANKWQKALFLKKKKSAFGNVSKHYFSKKLHFEIQRIGAKALLINITIESSRNGSNYPHLTNHKIHWKLKRQTQKIIATICRNLHDQSHSQQPDLNIPTWLRLSNEGEFWCINLTSIPIWFWGYEDREVLKIFCEIKRNYLKIFPIWNKLL